MGIELNEQQKELNRELHKWRKSLYKPFYYYSGGAGTGKTTILNYFIQELGLRRENYITTAYIGKAVLVLMRKGVRACTLHSLLYDVKFKYVTESYFDKDGELIEYKKKKMEFVLKEKLDPDIELICVDEFSMVNDQIFMDLLSFQIPVIVLGDHNQLPPVIGKSSFLDNPDFILTQIMRQAENNPIVYIAQCILNDKPLQYGTYGNSRIRSSVDINKKLLTDYDMIICAKNKMRDNVNRTIREEILNIKTIEPRIGEKMICRQNNWNETLSGIALTNGLVGYVTDIDYSALYKDQIFINFQPDFMDDKFIDIPMDYKYLQLPYDKKKDYGFSKSNKFEYAYAITAHLSQGSEYDNILFLDDFFRDAELTKKLRYTAVTRAIESVDFILSEKRQSYYITYPNAA